MPRHNVFGYYSIGDKIAILGGGHAARGIAGYLSLAGFSVSLYNRTLGNVAGILKRGGLIMDGIVKGFAPLDMVTDNMAKAIKGRHLLIVTVPAHAHKYYAEQVAPHLQLGQVILLMPGRTGGAFEFEQILKKHVNTLDILLGEAQTFSFVSRATGSSSVLVSKMKNRVRISAFPATDNRMLMRHLRALPLPLVAAGNVLETSLDNIGAMLHPAPTILSAGVLESREGVYNHYHDAISESVGRFVERLDAERMRVAEQFSSNPVSLLEWLEDTYDASGDTLCEMIGSIDAYDDVGCPESIQHRYVLEDVPTGLVPISYLGQMADVNTPAIDSVVNIACHLYETNFWKTGRTLEKMGLGTMIPQEVVEYGDTGYKPVGFDSMDTLWQSMMMGDEGR